MAADIPLSKTAGLTVREVAQRYRVSPDKVRAWLNSGDLGAINTAASLCGRPRYVVLPHHLAEFEKRRTAARPAPVKRKRVKRTGFIDYFPN